MLTPGEFHRRINELEGAINARFSQVPSTGAFNSLDSKVSSLDKKLSELEGKVKGIDTTINDTCGEVVNSIMNSLSILLENGLKEIGSSIEQFYQAQLDTDKAVGQLSESIVSFKGNLSDITKYVEDNNQAVRMMLEFQTEQFSQLTSQILNMTNEVKRYIVELKSEASGYLKATADLANVMDSSSELSAELQQSVANLTGGLQSISETVASIQSSLKVLQDLTVSIIDAIEWRHSSVDISETAENVSNTLVNIKKIFSKEKGRL